MKRTKTQGIYAIANRVERKFYVGSSFDMETRTEGHKSRLRKGKHHSKRLQADWDRLGESAFCVMFLESVERKDELGERERFYMAAFDALRSYNTATPTERVYKIPITVTAIKTKDGWIRKGQHFVIKGKKEMIESISLKRSKYEVGKFGIFFFASRAHVGGRLNKLISVPKKYLGGPVK